jgi:hypothetical protein
MLKDMLFNVEVNFCVLKVFLKFLLLFFENYYFLMFLDYFDVLISKIIFKK